MWRWIPQSVGVKCAFSRSRGRTSKMLEINSQLTKLKELNTRTDSLRGYL